MINRISATGFNFDDEGGIMAFYYDGDIFWGHSIIVNVGIDGIACNADIAG